MQLKLDLQQRVVNCFVRLHPSAVQHLYNQALTDATTASCIKKTVSHDEDRNSASTTQGWHVARENENDILFLPLKISFRNNNYADGQKEDEKVTSIFASYNGGLSSQGTFLQNVSSCHPSRIGAILHLIWKLVCSFVYNYCISPSSMKIIFNTITPLKIYLSIFSCGH